MNPSRRDAQLNTPAERMRRHRTRRAAGIVRLAAELDAKTVACLVDRGYLAADRQRDGCAVGAAVSAFLHQELGVGDERGAPPVITVPPPREPTLGELLVAAWERRQAAQ